MTDPDLFDLLEGRRLAEQGAERAANHAERVSEGWRDKAFGYATEFIRSHNGRPFMTEQIRQFAYERGFERAPDERAWGAIMLKVARRGLVRRLGFARSSAKNVHGNPATLWEASA
jgi:hypothetical protein